MLTAVVHPVDGIGRVLHGHTIFPRLFRAGMEH
jgi:hypothetical protein